MQRQNLIYCDVEDPETMEHVAFGSAKCIISTIPDRENSAQLIKALKREGYTGPIYLTALHEKDLHLLSDCGADQVLLPYQLAATAFYNSFIVTILGEDKAPPLDQPPPVDTEPTPAV